MIVSASRRTDIPAFYSDWLQRRIRAGWCTVPNPFNPRQVARVSLAPEDADALVFWTRHAAPILPLLPELDRRGFRYYFQYSITGYGKPLEARNPPLRVAIETFRALAERLPPGAVIWRYDPLVLGPAFAAATHLDRFATIAKALEGATRRVVVSFLTVYRRTERRVGRLWAWDREVVREPKSLDELPDLLSGLVAIARRHGLEVQACAEPDDLTPFGIARGKCIDPVLLEELFGGTWPQRKDPHQRAACGCVVAKDIGMSDTCPFGCAYCYAVSSDDYARRRYRDHDPRSPSLHGWYEVTGEAP